MTTEKETDMDNRNTSFGDDNRRALDVYYTDRNTKLFVKDGVLVEERIEVSAPRDSGLSSYWPSPPTPIPPPSPETMRATERNQTIETAEASLNYYNDKHNVRYQLVDPITSVGQRWASALWFHSNFTAKPEGQPDTFAELFFAELKIIKYEHESDTLKFLVTACRPLSGKTTKQCLFCGNTMVHPTHGFRHGRYEYMTHVLRPRRNGKAVSTSGQSERRVTHADVAGLYGTRVSPLKMKVPKSKRV